MANGAKEVIALANTQVGTKEKYSGGHWVNDQKYNRWYGTIPGYSQGGYGYPWCAVFNSWLLDQTGLKALGPRTASCLVAVSWFKSRSRWSAYPALGAQVFFGSGGGTHTGLVVGYDATYVYTVEGNTNTSGSAEGDGVYRKTRLRRDNYVYGYGYPKYSGGSFSADPNASKFGYKNKKTATISDLGTTPAKTKVVTVKKGQTLGAIAIAAGVSLAAVIGLNPGIKDPNVIHPGDKVTVPATPSKPSTPNPTPTKKPDPKPTKPSTPAVTAFPGASYFGAGKSNKYVTMLGQKLIKYGYTEFYKVGAGPTWTNADKNAVTAFQRSQGWSGKDADGIPGKESWDRLMTGKNLKPRVKATHAKTLSAPVKKAAPKVQEAKVSYSNNLDGWIREALTVMQKHGIPGSYDGIKRTIMRESGGNPRICNNWDSNARRGTPSCGLMQVIAPTFRAYHVSGTSWDVYNPVANIVAACNYAAKNYGSIDNVSGAY